MTVNSNTSIGQQEYLRKLAQQQAASAEYASQSSAAASFFSQGMDTYTSSEENTGDDVTIPSEQYNEMKPSMNMMRPPMPPMAPPEESSTAEETVSATEDDTDDADDTDDSTSSILSSISDTMRVNQDSIKAAMEKLGLSEDDLTDEDSLTELLEELNNGAKQRGLPSAGDTAIQNLITEITGSTSSDTASTVDSVEEA